MVLGLWRLRLGLVNWSSLEEPQEQEDYPRVAVDEVHVLLANAVGGHDEVSLIFAVLVIHYNNQFAIFDIFNGAFNTI